MKSFKDFSIYAPLVARLGISFVFLWFGINQLIDPETFMGYLPDFLLTTSYAHTIVIFNGCLDLVLGMLLLIGLYTRLASLIIVVRLLAIILNLGYNDVAARDVGLMIVTFSLFLGGADKWSLDYRREKKSQQ